MPFRCTECGLEFDTETDADFHVSEAGRDIPIERTGVDLLDTGGCPSMQHERRMGGMNPTGVIVRHCCLARGHDGNHMSALGFEWTDAQEVKVAPR